MDPVSLVFAQGRVGVIDAAFVRWLEQQRDGVDYLAVRVTRSIFEPVLPIEHLQIFLSALEPVDIVLGDNDELPQGITTITWPEAELLDYSMARICKRSAFEEDRSDKKPAKLSHLNDLVRQYGPRPRRSEVVGLVSGSFDVIHPAHVYFMQIAKHRVDRLVVLTMSSDSIRRQEKNRLGDRPVYNERDRVEVLSALRPVDHVVVFDDLDCLPSLRDFCPDYFFKSLTDRSRPIVKAEAELVNQLGGQTIYLEGLPGGCSSTSIIDYVRKQERQ